MPNTPSAKRQRKEKSNKPNGVYHVGDDESVATQQMTQPTEAVMHDWIDKIFAELRTLKEELEKEKKARKKEMEERNKEIQNLTERVEKLEQEKRKCPKCKQVRNKEFQCGHCHKENLQAFTNAMTSAAYDLTKIYDEA